MASKIKALLLSAFIALLSLGELPGTAFAAETATIHAQGKFSSGRIVISGAISSGADQWITLAAKGPTGKLLYIDQTTSGADGKFAFEFPRGDRGVYNFVVNGSGAGPYAGTISESSVEDPTDPTDPPVVQPGNGGSGDVGGRPDVWNVSAEQLAQLIAAAGHETVNIDLSAGIRELVLPPGAIAKLQGHALAFKQGDLAVRIGELSALFAGLTDSQLAGATVVFSAERAGTSDVPDSSRADLIFAGDSYHLKLFLRTSDGAELPFSGGTVIVELPYRSSADPAVLGIYRYNEESGQWEYRGGEVDAARHVVTTTLTGFSQYAVMSYDKRFADVPATHWAYAAIRTLSAKYVVFGENETRYAPAREVTRAEFAALLVRLLKLEASGLSAFDDVRSDDWFARDVAAAYEAGIVSGRTDKRFAPRDVITREEMAVMLARSFRPGADVGHSNVTFGDERSLSGWAAAAVRDLAERKLLAGDRQGNFNPKATLTRAEAAQAIYNLQQALAAGRVLPID